MNFKNFIKLNEVFNNDGVELGDILSSLQSIKDNIDNIKRKNLIDMLNSVVTNIIPFLKTKNDKDLLFLLQKIAYAIKNDIEENNDFRETIESSVQELENYFKKNNIVLTKTNSPDTDNISDPTKKEPKDVKVNQDLSQPTDNMLNTPPLAGNGENSFTNI